MKNPRNKPRRAKKARIGERTAERIQKVLAEAGLGSRRELERLIAEGRVAVDGRRARLGDRITGAENIFVNGRPVRLRRRSAPHAHLAYYKPAGEVTTRDDPDDRPTVFERLPKCPRGRWIGIGRLDLNTSGLLLMTTDGELGHRLTHPRYEISREYAVRLLGTPSEEQLGKLKAGVELEDGLASFDSVEMRGDSGRNRWLHVVLREGRNREVRRMFDALGLPVSRLIRVRYGPIRLGRMPRGSSRALLRGEIAALYEAVGLAQETAESQSQSQSQSRSGSQSGARNRSPNRSPSRSRSRSRSSP